MSLELRVDKSIKIMEQIEEEKELALWMFKSITPTALRIAITSCIRDKVEFDSSIVSAFENDVDFQDKLQEFAFEAAQAIAKADFEMRGKMFSDNDVQIRTDVVLSDLDTLSLEAMYYYPCAGSPSACSGYYGTAAHDNGPAGRGLYYGSYTLAAGMARISADTTEEWRWTVDGLHGTGYGAPSSSYNPRDAAKQVPFLMSHRSFNARRLRGKTLYLIVTNDNWGAGASSIDAAWEVFLSASLTATEVPANNFEGQPQPVVVSSNVRTVEQNIAGPYVVTTDPTDFVYVKPATGAVWEVVNDVDSTLYTRPSPGHLWPVNANSVGPVEIVPGGTAVFPVAPVTGAVFEVHESNTNANYTRILYNYESGAPLEVEVECAGGCWNPHLSTTQNINLLRGVPA